MTITFEEFCSRPFDFVGAHVFFCFSGYAEEEFFITIEDVEYCMSFYAALGCEEVYVVNEQ